MPRSTNSADECPQRLLIAFTVTDTATGTVRHYLDPSGRFASVDDTGAF